MSEIAFRRLADSPPPERELLVVGDDGTARAWRSNGPVIGRFEGSAPDLADLRTAVDSLSGVEPPGAPHLPAGAALEVLEPGDGRQGRFVGGAPADGPWGAALEACRRLLDRAVDAPAAAIALVLLDDGHLRLAHRGSEVLPIELGSLRLDLVLWRDGIPVTQATTLQPGLGTVMAAPGWAVDLAIPSLDPAGGGTLVATAAFVAEDSGVYVPVRITLVVQR